MSNSCECMGVGKYGLCHTECMKQEMFSLPVWFIIPGTSLCTYQHNHMTINYGYYHTSNSRNSMGVGRACSCMQLKSHVFTTSNAKIHSRTTSHVRIRISTTSHVRIRISTTSHVRIRISYCKSRVLRLNVQQNRRFI